LLDRRFFSLARWSADRFGLILCDLAVRFLLRADVSLTIAVDDTLFKRTGKKVFGVAPLLEKAGSWVAAHGCPPIPNAVILAILYTAGIWAN
jgi:hypothetical protein